MFRARLAVQVLQAVGHWISSDEAAAFRKAIHRIPSRRADVVLGIRSMTTAFTLDDDVERFVGTGDDVFVVELLCLALAADNLF